MATRPEQIAALRQLQEMLRAARSILKEEPDFRNRYNAINGQDGFTPLDVEGSEFENWTLQDINDAQYTVSVIATAIRGVMATVYKLGS